MKLYVKLDKDNKVTNFKLNTLLPERYTLIEFNGDMDYFAFNMDLFSVSGSSLVQSRIRTLFNEVHLIRENNDITLLRMRSKNPNDFTFNVKELYSIASNINGKPFKDYIRYNESLGVYEFHTILKEYVEVSEDDERIHFSVFEV